MDCAKCSLFVGAVCTAPKCPYGKYIKKEKK
jgi:hypothetical protein